MPIVRPAGCASELPCPGRAVVRLMTALQVLQVYVFGFCYLLGASVGALQICQWYRVCDAGTLRAEPLATLNLARSEFVIPRATKRIHVALHFGGRGRRERTTRVGRPRGGMKVAARIGCENWRETAKRARKRDIGEEADAQAPRVGDG